MKAGKFLLAWVLLLCGNVLAQAQTIDEVYKKALAEGGTLNFYGTLAQINAEIILPGFEKRFPGIKVNHVDATADQLAARVIAESRGGKVIADVFQTLLDGLVRVQGQGLFLDQLYPEATAYPAEYKGVNWVASDLIYIVPAWNTTKVRKQDEPSSSKTSLSLGGKTSSLPNRVTSSFSSVWRATSIKAMKKRSPYSNESRPTILNFTRATRSWPNSWWPDRRRRALPVTRTIIRFASARARRSITC
jgi:hypothetical protein